MGLDTSLFVSDEIQAREVELPDGSKHTLHFRQVPAAEFRKFHKAERSEDEDVQAGSMAKLIAASLCEEDGKTALSYARAAKLNAAATNAIFLAVLDVNGMGSKESPGKG
jgi:hypothetical protein